VLTLSVHWLLDAPAVICAHMLNVLLLVLCVKGGLADSTEVEKIFPNYTPCPSSAASASDPRRLYVSTFKTGNDSALEKKFFLEGQGFNNSGGASAHNGGLQDIRIVGQTLRFWKKKFFYHPFSSLQYVREAIARENALGNDPNDAYSLHVDYDTVLTGTSMARLWEKFDCARRGKPILLAGETGCLAGNVAAHVCQL